MSLHRSDEHKQNVTRTLKKSLQQSCIKPISTGNDSEFENKPAKVNLLVSHPRRPTTSFDERSSNKVARQRCDCPQPLCLK
ncbi:hypothetical protein J6590_024137 [Homalodisca vitripennis]|nr:hypothetical protein J6590_024137 [Homalodisca vitripennis]